MLISMTGYGKSLFEFEGKTAMVQLRSLNSKQTDINIKLPVVYRERENAFRNLLAKALVRGKIELQVQFENKGMVSDYGINRPVFEAYLQDLQSVANDLNLKSDTDYMAIISRFPDVISSALEKVGDAEWMALNTAIEEAVEQLNQFRTNEGAELEKDISERVQSIIRLKDQVTQYEEERIAKVKERITTQLRNHELDASSNPDRFEQELIYYIEKLDITEEKVRLQSHCDYFTETMNQPADNGIGKKLGFIAQEMGREINTMGSKANHTEIQRLVVQMKDELEKIKEQLLNVL